MTNSSIRSLATRLPRSAVGRPRIEPSTTLRSDVVQVVREQVREGRYRPAGDEVVEVLAAWLFLRTSVSRAS